MEIIGKESLCNFLKTSSWTKNTDNNDANSQWLYAENFMKKSQPKKGPTKQEN